MLGETAEDGALTINCWAFGFSLLFIGLIVWRLGGSVWVGVAAQGVAAVAWEFVRMHLFALSEPLYLALMTGGVWAFVEYQLGKRPVWLALSAVLLSLSVMCRYAGVSIAMGAAAYLVWRSPRQWKAALAMSAVMLIPLALRMATYLGYGHLGVGRTFGFYMPTALNLTRGLHTLGNFIAQESDPVSYSLLGAGALDLIALGLLFRRTRLIGWLGCCYAALLLVSSAVSDRGLAFDMRILLPLGVMLLIIVMVMLAQVIQSLKGWRSRASVACAAVSCLMNYANTCEAQTQYGLAAHYRRDFGYEAYTCKSSPILARFNQLPLDVVAVSDESEVLHYLTGRVGLSTPAEFIGDEARAVRRIKAALPAHRVVLIDALPVNKGPEDARTGMLHWFDLTLLAQEKDGALYWVSERQKNSEGEQANTEADGDSSADDTAP